MDVDLITYKPIGVIRSIHSIPEKTPIQPVFAHGCRGRAEILPEYADGLKDIEGFSHIYLIFHFHKSGDPRLIVRPYLQDMERGIFATRSPSRSNPIGFSIVELLGRDKNSLILDGVDILDGTPLLDIKPYISRYDCIGSTRNGWQEDVDDTTALRKGTRGYKKQDETCEKKTFRASSLSF